jgi:hypothetical protein
MPSLVDAEGVAGKRRAHEWQALVGFRPITCVALDWELAEDSKLRTRMLTQPRTVLPGIGGDNFAQGVAS